MTRHFVDDHDLTAAQQAALLDLAAGLKVQPARWAGTLAGRTVALLFQKSSTRTRVSFEAGIAQLGGTAIFLSRRDGQLGRGESIADTAQVLSRYVDLMVIRTFAHAEVRDLAAHSRVPVINGLDDLVHPCQALADLLTLREHHGALAGKVLAYVGDGNNMAHSLMLAGALAGLSVRIIGPTSHAPDPKVVARARRAARPGADIVVTDDLEALAGAHAVYTDVWASMGQEQEQSERARLFAPYTVDARAMARARPNACFLHCLPAHRGEEVTADVIDGPASRVFDQAENRLHVQKALMVELLNAAAPAKKASTRSQTARGTAGSSSSRARARRP